MTDKALIEKAFKKYCLVCCSYRQTNGSDECENTNICKHARPEELLHNLIDIAMRGGK